MFASGSARMFAKTKKLMAKVAELVKEMPNELSIRGHTDGTPYGSGADYTNWELSADRANASRRAMLDAGIPSDRLNNVMGKADTEHLYPETPKDPRNRRISIIMLKEELTNPEKFEEMAQDAAIDAQMDAEEAGALDDDLDGNYDSAPRQVPVGTFRKTPGAVQFP